MKILNNKVVEFINGYLAAFNDIDGEEKREFITNIKLISSDNADVKLELEKTFEFLVDVKVIKKECFTDDKGLEYLFEKLILIKPFGRDEVSYDKLNEYRNYVIFHLIDYLDFAFEEAGIGLENTKTLQIIHGKDKNQDFIVLIITYKNIKLFFLFFSKVLNRVDFIDWFNSIVTHYGKIKQNGMDNRF